MRIAFDYTAARSHWPGVGRYGRELVRALVQRPDCPELVLFSHGRGRPLPSLALGLEGVEPGRIQHKKIPGPRRLWHWRARYRLGGIEPFLSSAGLMHGILGLTPQVRGMPTILPVFELPIPKGGRSSALGGCAQVLVGSEAGRRELIASPFARGLSPNIVRAVITGADHWRRDADPLDVDDLLRAGPLRFLVLGAIAHARRPLQILRGFEKLVANRTASEPLALHFDGRPGDAAREFKDALTTSPAAASVTWNADPNEKNLPDLVASSTVLIHLSSRELSPITPLEAMHFGVSILASKISAFQAAISGETLVEFPTETDPSALAAAMLQALDSGLTQEARRVRMEQAAPYTLAACAKQHIDIWRGVVQSPA